MKLSKLLERLEYEVVQGSVETEVTTLANDSRKVESGSVFVCISGAVFDGHQYVSDVAKKGAAAIIAERDIEAPKGVTVIKAENTRYALALMSAAYFGYPAEKLKVIGITGTKGKTTTTYLIRSILEGVGHKVGLIGTIEAIIGDRKIPAANTTPESFTIQQYFAQMVEEGCDSVVMEVSSQGLMLHRTAGIPFEIGIFTNLGKDHIGPNEHKDFEDYKRCKAMLFQQCKLGIANIDDPYYADIFRGATCKVETFGFSPKADLRAENVNLVSKPGYLGVSYHVAGKADFDVEIDIPGKFSVYNSLTAIAVCRHFGVPSEKITEALKTAHVKGRIEMIKVSDDFTLMIDYAHNAMSLESLLTTLKEYDRNVLYVCSDVAETVQKTEDMRWAKCRDVWRILRSLLRIIRVLKNHRRLSMISKSESQRLTGHMWRSATEKKRSNMPSNMVSQGDVIVLAGKGHEDYQEIKGVKYPMDERTLIAEVLEEIREN